MPHLQRPSPDPVTGVAIPSAAGTYALVLHLAAPALLNVSRLGAHTLAPGTYVYVGSAHGPGGLRARVGRHLRGTGPQHWHIDTLRSHATIRAVIYTVTEKGLECSWTQALMALPGAHVPIHSFGSSDCRAGCAAHLIMLPPGVNLQRMQEILSETSAET
jgi:Uri superfamily endonuclease